MRLLLSAGCLLCCLPSSWNACEIRCVASAIGTKTGFIEYYLGRINPQRIDYGESIQAARRRWVESSIGDLGFWTTLAMFLLSVLGFVLVLHQHQEKNRREIIAANLLAEYHNAWVEAGRRAEEAIARYNDLANTTQQESLPWRVGSSVAANPVDDSGRLAMYLESNFGPPERRRRQKHSPTELRSRERIAVGEPDLLNQVSALQQQLSAVSEREKNLERELARSPRKRPPQALPTEEVATRQKAQRKDEEGKPGGLPRPTSDAARSEKAGWRSVTRQKRAGLGAAGRPDAPIGTRAGEGIGTLRRSLALSQQPRAAAGQPDCRPNSGRAQASADDENRAPPDDQ